MNEETPRTPSEPAGGDGLMMIISVAVVAVVVGEAAFVAFPSLWLLPLAILGALVVTGGVIYAAMRTIENDTPVTLPKPAAKSEPASAPTATPVRARPVIGH
jgi:hypothetical protein